MTIDNTQKVSFTVTAKNKNGNVVNANVSTVVQSGSGTIDAAGFFVAGATGESILAVSVTADFGNGVQTIVKQVAVEVTEPTLPDGASIDVTFDTPQPK